MGPGRAFIFLLTAYDPVIGLSREGLLWLQERDNWVQCAYNGPLKSAEMYSISLQVILITAAFLLG